MLKYQVDLPPGLLWRSLPLPSAWGMRGGRRVSSGSESLPSDQKVFFYFINQKIKGHILNYLNYFSNKWFETIWSLDLRGFYGLCCPMCSRTVWQMERLFPRLPMAAGQERAELNQTGSEHSMAAGWNSSSSSCPSDPDTLWYTVSFKLNFIYTASLIQPRREIQTKETKES